MDVFIERENRTESLTFSGTALALIQKLDINPQTVLILRNDTLITEDEIVEDNDMVKLLAVVSGG